LTSAFVARKVFLFTEGKSDRTIIFTFCLTLLLLVATLSFFQFSKYW
jgi:hypothetical protein